MQPPDPGPAVCSRGKNQLASLKIDLLTVGVRRIFQIPDGLIQNSNGRDEPDNRFGPVVDEGIEDRFDGIAGDEGFSSGCWHLDTDVGNTRHIVFVGFKFHRLIVLIQFCNLLVEIRNYLLCFIKGIIFGYRLFLCLNLRYLSFSFKNFVIVKG